MGCCDDDRSQATRSINEDDPSQQELENSEEENVNPEQEQQDAWATAEGYTPLADLNPYNAGSMMVSFGVGADNDEHAPGPGAFFVNPSAFDSAYDDDEDAGNGESEFVISENNSLLSSLGEGNHSFDDFQNVADNALSALEAEYDRTLRGERPPRWSEQPSPSTATAMETKHDGGQSEDHQNDDERAGDTQPSTDEDLKVIVEAFDKLKAESENGNKTFDVDWGNMKTATNSASATPKPLPPVDTEAVRKAVSEISLKTEGNFQQKFAAWKERQEQPDTHELIPKTPYKAFRRSTDKARQASATLSRSATIAEVLVRLADQKLLDTKKESISIHVIGVDHVECESAERIQTLFRPITRWLGVWNKCQCTQLYLRLNGRELRNPIPGEVDLLTPGTASRLSSAVATCHTGLYEEWLEKEKPESPDLIIAFNAGIWGYQEWATTVDILNRRSNAQPFIITAYTLEECQEDCEVIQSSVADDSAGKILWEPTMNPFGSKIIRETKSSSQEYRENACWQAWLLGGI